MCAMPALQPTSLLTHISDIASLLPPQQRSRLPEERLPLALVLRKSPTYPAHLSPHCHASCCSVASDVARWPCISAPSRLLQACVSDDHSPLLLHGGAH